MREHPASTRPWRGSRVLVTGATGMIGSWLTAHLLERGAHVVALVADMDSRSEFVRSRTLDRVSVVSGRLEDFSAIERAVTAHEVDTVFHLGAQTIVGAAHRAPRLTFEANVQGTWNVLEASRLHSDLVRRIVIASSDKAYGPHDRLPYVEDMPLIAGGPYEASKSCTDLIAQSFHKTYGLPLAIARCGNVYGGGDLNWSRLVPGTIRSLLTGERPVIRSDGTYLRDYIFVEDVVNAYLILAESLSSPDVCGEAFNFSDESPLSVLMMFDYICAAVGRSRPEPLVMCGATGEIKDQYLSAAKARHLLGWKAVHSIDEGLRRTVEWYETLFTIDRVSGA